MRNCYEKLSKQQNFLDTVLIDTNHIYIFPQHDRYDLNHDEIFLRLIGQPAHGIVTKNARPIGEDTFAYTQITQHRINYTHDGSESLEDTIEFEVWRITQ